MHLSSGRKSKIRGKIQWRGSHHLPSNNGRLWAAHTPQPAWLCRSTAKLPSQRVLLKPSQAPVPHTGLTHISWDAFHWKAAPERACRGSLAVQSTSLGVHERRCPVAPAEPILFQEQHQTLLLLFGLAHRTRKEQKMLALKRSLLWSLWAADKVRYLQGQAGAMA